MRELAQFLIVIGVVLIYVGVAKVYRNKTNKKGTKDGAI